jgi:hypothetical protein
LGETEVWSRLSLTTIGVSDGAQFGGESRRRSGLCNDSFSASALALDRWPLDLLRGPAEPEAPVSVRGHSVASSHTVENRGSPVEDRGLPRCCGSCDEPRKARVSPEGLEWRGLPCEHPRAFWWVPKSPMDSGESGERPRTLGGGSRARWGTEVLRCTVCRAIEP